MKYLAIGLAFLAFVKVTHADLVGHHEGASELLLSGDGKVAFSSDAKQTRVWDVEARRELAALPGTAGSIVASSGDGHRVLMLYPDLATYRFWRLNSGKWQLGSLIPQQGFGRVLDAHFFDNGEVSVMWMGNLGRFASNGLLREQHEFDEGVESLSRASSPPGTLSEDGQRLLLWSGGWARICDAKSGRRLTPIHEPKDVAGYDRRYRFAPDNSLVLERVQYLGIDAGYLGEDGPPLLFDLAVYDAKNGRFLHKFESVGYFNCPAFRPADGKLSVLLQTSIGTSNSQWKLERRDLHSGEVLPLAFSNPGPPDRWLSHLYFSDDEKRIVALDEKGDLWQEKLQ